MKHTDKSGSAPFGQDGGRPGLTLLEIPRGQAATILAASGFVKQYDSGDAQTVLVQVVPQSTAYNLIKAQ